ncbi:MAG: AMP-binding protein, partial [bacterium]|nr:AMP-binding protein [bacterium]
MTMDANKNLILTASLYIKQKEYWVNKLTGQSGKTRLIREETAPVRPQATPSQKVDTPQKVAIPINDELYNSLKRLSKNNELSLYLLLLTALEALIYHYTGIEDIIIRTPLYQMNITEDTMNDHILLRQQEVGELTFKELLLGIRKTLFGAYENQDYPFDELIEFLYNSGQIGEKDGSTGIECQLQNIHGEKEYEEIGDSLVFIFRLEENGIDGRILYKPGKYRPFYLEQAARHLVGLLKNGLENLDIKIPEMTYLSGEEMQQLKYRFNETQLEYPKDKVIHQRFEQQAARAPGRIALIQGNQRVTYGNLNEKSNRLARHLREKGVTRDTIVGLLV